MCTSLLLYYRIYNVRARACENVNFLNSPRKIEYLYFTIVRVHTGQKISIININMFIVHNILCLYMYYIYIYRYSDTEPYRNYFLFFFFFFTSVYIK